MFEMLGVRRDNGKIVNGGGCGDCSIFKTGVGPRANRTIEQPTTFDSGGRRKRQHSGIVKLQNGAKPMGKSGGAAHRTFAFELRDARLNLRQRYRGQKKLVVMLAHPRSKAGNMGRQGVLRRERGARIDIALVSSK